MRGDELSKRMSGGICSQAGSFAQGILRCSVCTKTLAEPHVVKALSCPHHTGLLRSSFFLSPLF